MSKNPEKGKAEVVVREEQGERDLLSQILEEGRLARNDSQVEQAKDLIGAFVQQVRRHLRRSLIFFTRPTTPLGRNSVTAMNSAPRK